MMLDYIRQIRAQQNFKILDDFEITGFDDVSKDIEDEEGEGPQLDIWAEVTIKFEGKIPESYRVLNALIGDWVEEHTESLTDAIHPKIISFLKQQYSDDIDLNEIESGFEDSPIWADQLDYMPRVDEKKKSMIIEIELVLEHEDVEEKKDGDN